MPLCKMAIEAHGGEIDFDSEAGKGTTFRFTLQTDTDFEIKEEETDVEKNCGVQLIPLKDTMFKLKPDDCLVVLAEDEL